MFEVFIGSISVLEETERQQKQKLKKELKTFWKDVLLLLQKQPDGSALHNVARKDYEVKSLLIPSDLDDVEQKVCVAAKNIFVDQDEKIRGILLVEIQKRDFC